MKATTKEAYQLFHEGSIVLSQIESNGIRIDTDYLNRTIKESEDKIKILQRELREDKVYHFWRKRFGGKTNLGSREQLATILFGSLGYPCKEYTATGRPKADESSFEGIDLPFVKNYIALEKLKKLEGTFLKGIRAEVVDGFLHPVFNLHTVETFRSSGDSPNFHNIPVRNPEVAQAIRTAFIPRNHRRIGECDFSGIEVKIAACHHKDPTMMKYIKDLTTDMHRDMAAQCYILDPKEVIKTSRYCAKNMFVFPQFYGDYYINCAKHLWEAIDRMKLYVGIPGKPEEKGIDLKKHLAKKGIKSLGKCDPSHKPVEGTFEYHMKKVEEDFWWKRFPVYAEWKRHWWESYLLTGGFDMFTGFRVDGNYKKNEVINYPVQGAAFHCLLWSLIQIQKWLNKWKMKTLLVGQIHDSIVADIYPKEEQDFLYKVKRVMTEDLAKTWKWINVPLDIEVELTDINGNWFKKKQWIEKDGNWVEK